MKRNIKALERGIYDKNMKVSAYNRLTMAKYMQEQYDSSFYYVQIAIDMNPDVAFPYSSKAEAYLLMGDLQNFYKYIEMAVEREFSLESFIEKHPYSLIKDKSEMLEIINKYKNDIALKG